MHLMGYGLVAFLVLPAPVLASETVLYDGHEQGSAILLATRFTGASQDDIQAVTLSDLLRDIEVPAEDHAVVVTCTGTRTRGVADLRALNDRLASRLDGYQSTGTRSLSLQETEAFQGELSEILACGADRLDEVAIADVARAWMLVGAAFCMGESWDAAQSAFRQVGILKPDLAWDPDYSGEWERRFKDELLRVARDKPLNVPLRPVPSPGSLWVDGVATNPTSFGTLSLIRGAHLVQYGQAPVHSVLVQVTAEATPLRFPALVSDADVRMVTDSASWPALDELLAQALAPKTRLCAVVDDRVYEGVVGEAAWKELPSPDIAWRAVAWGGWGVAAIGGGFAAWNLVRAEVDHNAMMDTDDRAAYEEASTSRDSERRWATISGGVAAAGLVAAVVGAVGLDGELIECGPMGIPGGIGLRVGVKGW